MDGLASSSHSCQYRVRAETDSGSRAPTIACLSGIGAVTALIGDLANLFACVINLNTDVAAITIVALGTSLPDTFASQVRRDVMIRVRACDPLSFWLYLRGSSQL